MQGVLHKEQDARAEHAYVSILVLAYLVLLHAILLHAMCAYRLYSGSSCHGVGVCKSIFRVCLVCRKEQIY